MSKSCKLLGFGIDDGRSEDFMSLMIVLGARIQVVRAERRITSRSDEAKATKWAGMLMIMLRVTRLSPDVSLKMAGRLGAAVRSSFNQ